jgi:hypothetical protein
MQDLIRHALTQWQYCSHTLVGSQSKVFVWQQVETYTKCICVGVYEIWQKIAVKNLKELKWQLITTIKENNV